MLICSWASTRVSLLLHLHAENGQFNKFYKLVLLLALEFAFKAEYLLPPDLKNRINVWPAITMQFFASTAAYLVTWPEARMFRPNLNWQNQLLQCCWLCCVTFCNIKAANERFRVQVIGESKFALFCYDGYRVGIEVPFTLQWISRSW